MIIINTCKENGWQRIRLKYQLLKCIYVWINVECHSLHPVSLLGIRLFRLIYFCWPCLVGIDDWCSGWYCNFMAAEHRFINYSITRDWWPAANMLKFLLLIYKIFMQNIGIHNVEKYIKLNYRNLTEMEAIM